LVARGLPLGRLERIEARQRGAGRGEKALGIALVPDGFARVEVELARGSSVSGVVIDADTERPIPGAEVWAEDGWRSDDSPAPMTVADENGRFRLEGVEPTASGEPDVVWCLIAADAPGHVGQPFDVHVWRRSSEQRYEVELRLVPTSAR